ncbi:MAG: thiamine pyrophosphate-dependent dehydrogenase E1 component subunit alpha [Sinobacteraceae bacterium]|nr:thiamine pyrophosphate-dependent dehydrogenase E1 component subunit alpha [Nevskiaceae bacterium]
MTCSELPGGAPDSARPSADAPALSAGPGKDETLRCYAALWRIRLFEGHVQRLAAAGEVPGFPHLSTGQEAIAVGVCAHLKQADTLFTGHRGHGHALAKGCDLEATFAEIIGRESGLCRGRGGSMHLVDRANGMLGATGVVGGNLPLAAGAAWAAQVSGTDSVCAVFFGDGATGAGVFHETLNLAALWKLPLLFVCENNGYAEFTSRAEHSPVQQVAAFAAPYGVSAQTIDGNDLRAVHAAAGAAIAQLRRGEGPYLLECMTYRLAGHYVGDSQQYRSKEERAAALTHCPIQRLRRQLEAAGVSEAELEKIAHDAEHAVRAAVESARAAPRPDSESVFDYVYSAPLVARSAESPMRTDSP